MVMAGAGAGGSCGSGGGGVDGVGGTGVGGGLVQDKYIKYPVKITYPAKTSISNIIQHMLVKTYRTEKACSEMAPDGPGLRTPGPPRSTQRPPKIHPQAGPPRSTQRLLPLGGVTRACMYAPNFPTYIGYAHSLPKARVRDEKPR